jgi:hypothetical protein
VFGFDTIDYVRRMQTQLINQKQGLPPPPPVDDGRSVTPRP